MCATKRIAKRLIAKAPPGWGEAAMHRLKEQYPGEPEKAFATAWSLHGKDVSGKDYMKGKSSSVEADGDALDDNSELVLNHALGEVFSLRGPDGMDKAVLRQNVLSLAKAISRVDKAGKVAPEHILEAFQYLADFSSLYSFLKEERVAPPSHAEDQRGQLSGGPGSPIHGRIESVFREWGRPVPELSRESFQEFAESVGFKFSGPVPWPDDASPSAKDAGMKRRKGGREMHDDMLDMIVAKVCESITAKKTVKQRARGTSVFQSTHSKVKDNKDHFPINDLAHARNALARVMQYDSLPSWYNGTLGGLQSAVKRAVYSKFPGLKSRKKEREKAASDRSTVVPTEVEIHGQACERCDDCVVHHLGGSDANSSSPMDFLRRAAGQSYWCAAGLLG